MRARLLAFLSLLLLLAAASILLRSERKSGAGFHLPDGDARAGQEVFVRLRCHACHRVAGLDLPAPLVEPSVPVVLGGEVPHVKTDGELWTSVIDPSHRLPRDFPAELLRRGTASRMPDYGDILSVREMVDLVAFLQSRYRVVRPGRPAASS